MLVVVFVVAVGFFLLEYYFILFLQNELKLNRTETRQRWERKSVWFDSLLRKFNLFWFYSLCVHDDSLSHSQHNKKKSFVQQKKKSSQKKWKRKRRRWKNTYLHLKFVCFYVWLLQKHNFIVACLSSAAVAQWEGFLFLWLLVFGGNWPLIFSSFSKGLNWHLKVV